MCQMFTNMKHEDNTNISKAKMCKLYKPSKRWEVYRGKHRSQYSRKDEVEAKSLEEVDRIEERFAVDVEVRVLTGRQGDV